MKQAYIEAGRITSTHGVHGEVKIEVWLDTPEDLKHYRRIFIDGQKKKLLSVRQQNRFVIVKLHQIDDINAAQPLKGKTVFIAREDAPLPPGGYFLQDLLDAKVVLEDGSPVGVLTEILERPANNVYIVTDPD